jgi:aspartate racemase
MHAARVEAAIAVPLIDLVDATAREIRRRGMRTVGLLGTRLTMELDFFPRRLHAAGIDVIVPDEADRTVVDRTIADELVRSTFRAESRERFVTIIGGLGARGAEGVILGCTEIPLLVAPDQSPLPAFDTTQLHAMAAVDFALATDEEQLSSSVDRS